MQGPHLRALAPCVRQANRFPLALCRVQRQACTDTARVHLSLWLRGTWVSAIWARCLGGKPSCRRRICLPGQV